MATELAKLIDSDKLLELQSIDKFLAIVNHEPPTEWIKEHPFAKGVKYIPIDKVELMLTKVFQLWYVEILREGQLLNSIYVTVRLFYKHPINGEWMHQDGTGATPIQVDKGENASNLSAIKNDAIMKALPSAESYAIKDASEKIGKLFGKDLNRRDAVEFIPSYEEQLEEKKKAVKEKLDADN